jgi:hypothetical protein
MSKSKIKKIEVDEKEILKAEIKEFILSIQNKCRLSADENLRLHNLYNQYFLRNEKNYNCSACVNRIYVELCNIFA